MFVVLIFIISNWFVHVLYVGGQKCAKYPKKMALHAILHPYKLPGRSTSPKTAVFPSIIRDVKAMRTGLKQETIVKRIVPQNTVRPSLWWLYLFAWLSILVEFNLAYLIPVLAFKFNINTFNNYSFFCKNKIL